MKEAMGKQHTLGPAYTKPSVCRFHALFQSGLGDAGLHFCRTALYVEIHDTERRAKLARKSHRLFLRTS
jgi:hypothetical protein